MHIPSEQIGDSSNRNLIFVHGNGFTPKCYSPLLNILSNKFYVESMLLRPLWPLDSGSIKTLKDWSIFEEDLENFILQNRVAPITAIGHSIGGNIILKIALRHPEFFNNIILLDPTIFDRTTIFLWKLVCFLGIGKKFLKHIELAERKKMKYKSRINMYESYRKKNIFSKISDKNLMVLVEAITRIDKNNNVNLVYPNIFEAEIYKAGLMNDGYIWDNVHRLRTNCLIVRGQNTDVFLKKTSDLICSLSKKIKVKTLIGTSHLFPLEKPEKTYELFKTYLQ